MGFSKLTKPLRLVKDRIHRIQLDLPQYGAGRPTILVCFAGEDNDGYINAMIRRESRIRQVPMGPHRLRLGRELDAEIYARHVVTGWEHIFEDAPDQPRGVREAMFSVETCKELLLSLAHDAPDQFDRVYQATVRDYFRDPLPDAESLGEA